MYSLKEALKKFSNHLVNFSGFKTFLLWKQQMKVNTHTALCDITCQKNIKQINEIAFDFYDSLVSLKLLDCKNALELTPVRYKGKQCLKTVNSFPMKWGNIRARWQGLSYSSITFSLFLSPLFTASLLSIFPSSLN